MQKQIRIPAEMLILYPKSLQLIILLGSFPRRLKANFRFEQPEGLEGGKADGNKENPLYFSELNIVLPIERKISPFASHLCFLCKGAVKMPYAMV